MATERRWRQALLGIRGRVTLWFLLLFALLLVVGLVAIRQILLVALDEEVDQALAQESEELRLLAAGVDPETGEPFGGDLPALFDTFFARNVPGEGEVLVALVDGEVYDATPQPQAGAIIDDALATTWSSPAIPTWGTSPTPEGELRWLVVPVAAGGADARFAATSLIGHERDEIEQNIQVMALVSLGVLALASLLGWVTAGRLLAPIRDVTRAARSISESDLSARLDPVEGHDEVAELTATFNDMIERLDQAFVSQRRFLDDAGHDLRTPITIIRGQLELLPDEPQAREETIALCLDELDRMGRIVNDLLTLAKSEQPDFLTLAPVDVAQLTDELELRARAVAPDREWRVEQLALVEIEADEDRLGQAMMNLITNAIRHTDAGTQIRLGSRITTGERPELRLWVTDGGEGIPPREQAHVFERFRRGAGAARGDGSGLGLAIVQAIVEAHGGRVELASDPGVETTFTLVLPLSDDRTALPAELERDTAVETSDPTPRTPDPIEATLR